MNVGMELFDIFVISETVEQIIVVIPIVNNINRPCHSMNCIGKWYITTIHHSDLLPKFFVIFSQQLSC